MPSELPAPPLDALLRADLDALDAASLTRRLAPVRRLPGALLQDGADTLVDFASNDYLGLAADPRLAAAARDALDDGPLGAGAARLITGDDPRHRALERALAEHKRSERALLFPSGYAANAGTLATLAGRDDAIYSDALNHASIVDGCRLSRATVRIVPHGDVDALDAALGADAGRFRRRFVVVEGLYSMDGDPYPLDRLVPIARRHGAYTIVDDAHASGVLGDEGRGSAEHFGVEGDIDVIVGTLGKAFGASGAFVAGSAALCDVLLQRARPFVFTTGSPPAIAAAALRGLEIAREESWRRERVRASARRLRARLAEHGVLELGIDESPIVPVPIGDAAATIAVGEALRARGFVVGAIRPPTVPADGARLRLGVSAAHDESQIDAVASAVAETLADVLVSAPRT